jgi:hypothetical protein
MAAGQLIDTTSMQKLGAGDCKSSPLARMAATLVAFRNLFSEFQNVANPSGQVRPLCRAAVQASSQGSSDTGLAEDRHLGRVAVVSGVCKSRVGRDRSLGRVPVKADFPGPEDKSLQCCGAGAARSRNFCGRSRSWSRNVEVSAPAPGSGSA